MKLIIGLALVVMLAGCAGVNLAWRGVVINTTQDVQTGAWFTIKARLRGMCSCRKNNRSESGRR